MVQPFGDVLSNTQMTDEFSVGGTDRGDDHQHRHRRAILAHVGPLPGFRAFAGRFVAKDVNAFDQGAVFTTQLGGACGHFFRKMKHPWAVATEHFRIAVAQQQFSAPIEHKDLPLCIGSDDRNFRRSVQHTLQQTRHSGQLCSALADLLFKLCVELHEVAFDALAVGDVVHHFRRAE